jgi:hypothetical protein
MNRLNSIALLAGSALVAVAATGCASSAKPAAAGPAASSPATAAAPSTSASSAPAAPASSAPAAGSSSSAAGGSSSAPAAGGSSSTGSNSGSTGGSSGGSNAAAPVSHPVCDNAALNASLYQDYKEPPTYAIIAVKNTGPTCLINPIPYLWIVKSPTDASDELRPLVPGGTPGTAKLQTILSGTTLYAAVDLDPQSAPTTDTTVSYGYLEVTANPTKESSGKDVQDVQLSTAVYVNGPKLGVYANNPSLAVNALQYSDTPES